MNFQPRTIGERSAANDTIELRRPRLPGRDRITPSPGMNLDNRRADFARGLDLPRLGRDEQRNPNAGLGQFLDDATQGILLAGSVETTFGRPLLAAFRHNAGGMRFNVTC